MQIWIDAQLSPSLAPWINENFKEVQANSLRDLGLRDAADYDIFIAAKNAIAIVMTKDSDFINFLSQIGSPPQNIWITAGNTSNVRMREILLKHMHAVLNLLKNGEALVEINGA